MKIKTLYPCLVMLLTLSVFSSCKKDLTTASTSSGTTNTLLPQATITADGAIAISAAGSAKDSIYIVNCFPPGAGKLDSVAFSALPAAVETYLTVNYAGYTFVKALGVDSAKVLSSYIVIIKLNNSLIGLKFTATGTFVNVLEQKDGANMGSGGPGWHPNGPFSDRGGVQHDTIPLSAIPSVVLNYFKTTYPADTLLHASVTPDTTYILISKDTVLHATDISSTGTLLKRIKVEPHGGINVAISATELLPAITTYLTSTFPGYVFNKAFAEGNRDGVIGYHVFITVNTTNYVVNFNAQGGFLSANVIH
jgi:hypothetical protein